MLSLVRSGPKTIILECSDIEWFSQNIEKMFEDNIVKSTTGDIFTEDIGENATVLYIANTMKELFKLEDFIKIYVIYDEPIVIMTNLFNNKDKLHLLNARLGPRAIIMKCIGDMDAVARATAIDYNGNIENIDEILQNHNRGTAVFFTKGSIDKPLTFNDTHPKAVFIDEYFSSVIRTLSKHVYKYINQGLQYKDWNECIIKIYDNYRDYETHYNRLAYALEKLGVGLIIGESWSTDAATAFFSVEVYKIRFMTFMPVNKIKEILIGLEYNQKGERLVDYDLYYKKKKVYWDVARTEKIKNKKELGVYYRNQIFSNLDKKSVKYLLEIENTIYDKISKK